MKTTLSAVTSKIGSGATPRGGKSAYVDEGIAFVRSQNILDLSFSREGLALIDDEQAEALKNVSVQLGDVLINITGDSVARATLWDSGVPARVSQHVAIVRPIAELLDARFLQYLLVNPIMKSELLTMAASGGSRPALTKGMLESLQVELPSLCAQHAIAEVLGALDDKIAANRRVIDAGDALIRALYSSTPKASTGRTFADVAAIGGGGTPSTKNSLYWDGAVGWATPTDVTGADGPWLAHTTRRISEEGLKNCASPLYPEGSILMTSRATIGAVVVARKPMAVNQGFIVLNAVESEMQWWLESQLRARTAEFETWANGATFLEISRGTFKKLPVVECSPENLGVFNRTAQSVRERQSSCQAENDRLARTRDELLPLLMNGRITVNDAEGAVGDVV
ncbi:restriction endonuclease subunit S [uncultured Dietzia sp.]|uniref:restriction endonuclease subunit S n=1 Tax=uncultured Dietzia sp. TaxID=395519 RepID=UPI0030F8B2B7